ncbi:MAG: phosphate starvation-inducible protein PhoH [Solibacillus sp.]
MNEFLVVHPCNIFSHDTAVAPFDLVDMYELPNTDLTLYKAIILLNYVDQDFLLEEKQLIEQFLADGKLVCFFGNLVTPWLPGQEMFIPKEINWHGDYNVTIAKPHPIFDGVIEEHMTTNKGVKGFFARGHHPAPQGAEVLLTLPAGEEITYIDRNSTNGTIFMHVGFCFFDFSGNGGMRPETKKTTDRIPAQMLAWAQEELTRLAKGEKIDA